MQETLIILSKARAISDIESVARVLQRYGDRVLVVSTDNAGGLRALGDVHVVESGNQAPAEQEGVTATAIPRPIR